MAAGIATIRRSLRTAKIKAKRIDIITIPTTAITTKRGIPIKRRTGDNRVKRKIEKNAPSIPLNSLTIETNGIIK